MAHCQFCHKSSQKGNKISHSAVKTIKRSKPNVRVQAVSIDGKMTRVKICSKCLKKLNKKSSSK